MPDDLHARLTFLKAPTRDAVGDTAPVAETVAGILAEVKARGDAAVRDFSLKFDKAETPALEITMDEREAAVAALDPQTRADTEFAIRNVRSFAEAQMGTIGALETEVLPGVHAGHRVIPIKRVGCYVPGGRFPLLSAPVMTIVPAVVAGVAEIIACLPPNAHPAMIAGCHLSGATRIFRIGGAQAIAAMAFGTESVPRVNKIVGPGNAFVNEAKRQVFGPVGIDQLAGPSEIFILADETGDAEMIATDLLAQAEHDVRTRVGLITTHAPLAEAVLAEVEAQLATLSTASVARPAWEDYGLIAVAKDEADMIAYSEEIAAEHLQVHTKDPKDFALKLDNYGSLFIGENASVVYSDKCSGTNHTLPTMGAGQYTGGLWVGAYVKIATHQWLTEEGVKAVAPPAARQARSETLEGHRRAAQLRLDRMQMKG
ncbi:histidinol dehydrogenase [Pseudoroseicyclus sp. CXY001]|uniref:histidinol dehydrogenase n=1 Tax=Pseudoroseicyclus sp. CXY001 TaxID=3242492 RepID=UPI00358DC177